MSLIETKLNDLVKQANLTNDLIQETYKEGLALKTKNDEFQSQNTVLQQKLLNTWNELCNQESKDWKEYFEKEKTDLTEKLDSIDDEINAIRANDLKTSQLISENTNAKTDLDKLHIKCNDLSLRLDAELRAALDVATFKEYKAVVDKKEQTAKNWFVMFCIASTLLVVIGAWLYFGFVVPEIKDFTKIFKVVSGPESTYMFLLLNVLPKLLITSPLIALACFFLNRYLKEMRLAEEYRFKSTCAHHFNSYVELVNKINTDDQDEKYRDFIISQIDRLFTSPTSDIYKSSQKHTDPLQQLTEL